MGNSGSYNNLQKNIQIILDFIVLFALKLRSHLFKGELAQPVRATES